MSKDFYEENDDDVLDGGTVALIVLLVVVSLLAILIIAVGPHIDHNQPQTEDQIRDQEKILTPEEMDRLQEILEEDAPGTKRKETETEPPPLPQARPQPQPGFFLFSNKGRLT